jgi:hypothetical protein
MTDRTQDHETVHLRRLSPAPVREIGRRSLRRLHSNLFYLFLPAGSPRRAVLPLI